MPLRKYIRYGLNTCPILSTLEIGLAWLSSVAEIAPKSPFSCTNISLIQWLVWCSCRRKSYLVCGGEHSLKISNKRNENVPFQLVQCDTTKHSQTQLQKKAKTLTIIPFKIDSKLLQDNSSNKSFLLLIFFQHRPSSSITDELLFIISASTIISCQV